MMGHSPNQTQPPATDARYRLPGAGRLADLNVTPRETRAPGSRCPRDSRGYRRVLDRACAPNRRPSSSGVSSATSSARLASRNPSVVFSQSRSANARARSPMASSQTSSTSPQSSATLGCMNSPVRSSSFCLRETDQPGESLGGAAVGDGAEFDLDDAVLCGSIQDPEVTRERPFEGAGGCRALDASDDRPASRLDGL